MSVKQSCQKSLGPLASPFCNLPATGLPDQQGTPAARSSDPVSARHRRREGGDAEMSVPAVVGPTPVMPREQLSAGQTTRSVTVSRGVLEVHEVHADRAPARKRYGRPRPACGGGLHGSGPALAPGRPSVVDRTRMEAVRRAPARDDAAAETGLRRAVAGRLDAAARSWNAVGSTQEAPRPSPSTPRTRSPPARLTARRPPRRSGAGASARRRDRSGTGCPMDREAGPPREPARAAAARCRDRPPSGPRREGA